MSLSSSSVHGGGGVGQKFNPFCRMLVSEGVSLMEERFTIRFSNTSCFFFALLALPFLLSSFAIVHFRSFGHFVL